MPSRRREWQLLCPITTVGFCMGWWHYKCTLRKNIKLSWSHLDPVRQQQLAGGCWAWFEGEECNHWFLDGNSLNLSTLSFHQESMPAYPTRGKVQLKQQFFAMQPMPCLENKRIMTESTRSMGEGQHKQNAVSEAVTNPPVPKKHPQHSTRASQLWVCTICLSLEILNPKMSFLLIVELTGWLHTSLAGEELDSSAFTYIAEIWWTIRQVT